MSSDSDPNSPFIEAVLPGTPGGGDAVAPVMATAAVMIKEARLRATQYYSALTEGAGNDSELNG